jgi:hypothetical protein
VALGASHVVRARLHQGTVTVARAAAGAGVSMRSGVSTIRSLYPVRWIRTRCALRRRRRPPCGRTAAKRAAIDGTAPARRRRVVPASPFRLLAPWGTGMREV